jgi:uncharacterized protein (DUF342 family)
MTNKERKHTAKLLLKVYHEQLALCEEKVNSLAKQIQSLGKILAELERGSNDKRTVNKRNR